MDFVPILYYDRLASMLYVDTCTRIHTCVPTHLQMQHTILGFCGQASLYSIGYCPQPIKLVAIASLNNFSGIAWFD